MSLFFLLEPKIVPSLPVTSLSDKLSQITRTDTILIVKELHLLTSLIRHFEVYHS